MSRAQQILNDLVTSRTLTPAGLAWLTLAVDPWHDTAVSGLEGMPDQGIGKSVSFQVVQEMSISKNTAPSALPAGNWSCRIGTFPVLTSQQMCQSQYYGDVMYQNNVGVQFKMDSVQVTYAPDGTNFPDLGIDGLVGQGLNLPLEYTKGVCKVIGIGVEVINTTSQLNRQGLASFCRMVQPDSESYYADTALATPANAWGRAGYRSLKTLPINLAEMALYPGFAQHEAAEGYYAPVLLKLNRCRSFPTPLNTCLLADDPEAGPINYATGIQAYTTRLNPISVPGNTTIFNASNATALFYDGDSNVIIFSGLSDATTLTLRVRYILERFPSDSEGQMLVIATPSAVYDPVALELYSRAVQRLPAGVSFNENPAGEWWGKMVKEIAEAAAPFLSVLHPTLGAAARGVGAIAGAATQRTQTSRKKKARKAANQSVVATVIPAGAKKIMATQSQSTNIRKKPLPQVPQRKKA